MPKQPYDILQEQFTELRKLYEVMKENCRRLQWEVEALREKSFEKQAEELAEQVGDVRDAFAKLHEQWLSASHRRDMNIGMDSLATALGIDPYTLKPTE